MDQSKLLSVIMPLYNTEEYLDKSILSVLNQSYKNIEFIIVNDCSTDKSLIKAKEICNGHENVKFIDLDTNYGAGYARNVGLKNSKGELVAFIDSDDWIDLDYYTVLVDNMTRFNSDIAVSGILNEYKYNKKTLFRYNYKYENSINSLAALNLLTRSYNTDYFLSPIVNNKIYKKALFSINNLRFLDKSDYEDDIMTFWLFYYSKKISISSITNYHYLQRESSIMHTFSNKHINDLFDAFQRLRIEIEKIETQNECPTNNLYYKYFEKCFTSLLHNLYTLETQEELQKQYLIKITSYLKQNFNEYEILNIIGLDTIKSLYS